jgi:hypothetical protein
MFTVEVKIRIVYRSSSDIVLNRVFNGPCTMAGSSVLDSMIGISSHERDVKEFILIKQPGSFDRASAWSQSRVVNLDLFKHRFP